MPPIHSTHASLTRFLGWKFDSYQFDEFLFPGVPLRQQSPDPSQSASAPLRDFVGEMGYLFSLVEIFGSSTLTQD